MLPEQHSSPFSEVGPNGEDFHDWVEDFELGPVNKDRIVHTRLEDGREVIRYTRIRRVRPKGEE